MSATFPRRVAPGLSIVVMQQMRLLWKTGRVLFLAALVLGGLVSAATVAAYLEVDGELFMLHASAILLAAAGLWGVVIWRDEGPRSRHYHWSLPVDMMTHDLARVAAGAAWLFIMIAAYAVLGSVMAYLAGDAQALGRAAPLMALHFALAPLTLYLMTAALATASNRPFEWLLMGYVALAVAVALAAWQRQDWIVSLVESMFGKPYGLGWALIAGGVGAEVRVATPAQAEVSVYLAEWLPFAAMWLLIGAGILAGVAYRRRGRAP
jgi:hypothetical protein